MAVVVVVGTAIGLEEGQILGDPGSATGEDGGVRGALAGVPKDFVGDAVGDFVGVPVLLKEPAGERDPVETVSWGLVILVSISDSS